MGVQEGWERIMSLDLNMVKARYLWGIQRAVLEAAGQTSRVRERIGGRKCSLNSPQHRASRWWP